MTPERARKLEFAARYTQPDLTVVLENIYDPLNISAVMRSCDAVGIREIYVLYTAEYLQKRELVLGKRTSAGTFKWTDVYIFEDMDECFSRVRERYGRILATLPGEGSHSLFELDLTQPTALLFGNEDEGISKEAIARCDGFFTIPQAGLAESLNISVACAVSLYEAYRQRAAKGYYTDQPVLSEAQQQLLFQRWSTILRNEVPRHHGQPIHPGDAPLLPVYDLRPNERIRRAAKPHPRFNDSLHSKT